MGMFSYMCNISGNQIRSDLDEADPKRNVVRLYHLVDGVVQEEIRGVYNGYGAVEIEDQTAHFLRIDGEMVDVLEQAREKSKEADFAGDLWLSDDWTDMVDLHFDPNDGNGMAAVLEAYVKEGYVPNCISEDDENQGWEKDEEEEDCYDDEYEEEENYYDDEDD